MATSTNVEGVDLIGTPVVSAPVVVGGEARGDSLRSPVDDGDAVHLMTDLQGRLIVLPNTPMRPRAGGLQGPATAFSSDNVEQIVVAAPAAGFRLAVTIIQATQAGAGDNTIFWQEGLGAPPAGWTMLLPGGGGSLVPFAPPWILPEATPLVGRSTGNNDDVWYNAHFFTIPI